MSILALLYWIILVLSFLGIFTPNDWKYGLRVSGLSWVALFVIIGLKYFKLPLN